MLEVISYEFMKSLLINYWYLGAFIIGLLSSATLFLPTPAFLLIFWAGKSLDPLILGFAAGIGSALGELTGYLIGVIGEKTIIRKYEDKIKEIEKKFEKHHPSIIIFSFALLPLPFDAVGIFCGMIKYPLKKFLNPLIVGKVFKYWIIAYSGYFGLNFIYQIMGW